MLKKRAKKKAEKSKTKDENNTPSEDAMVSPASQFPTKMYYFSKG
jgi:hypothetical protein